jgi:hypothetical protein
MDEVFSKGFELWQATLALAFAVISLAGNWLPWLMWSGFCYFCIDWPQARRLINGQTAAALLLLFFFVSALLATMDPAFSPIASGNPSADAWRLAPWTAAIVQLTFIVGVAIAMGTVQLLAGHRLPHFETISETMAQQGR